jgi:hypothetical protein
VAAFRREHEAKAGITRADRPGRGRYDPAGRVEFDARAEAAATSRGRVELDGRPTALAHTWRRVAAVDGEI